MVCRHSSDPPAYFRCEVGDLNSSKVPAKSPSPSISASPSASAAPSYITTPILVKLKLDLDPSDVSWHIQDSGANPRILITSPAGEYHGTYSTYLEKIDILRPDTEYTLVLVNGVLGGLNGQITIFLGWEQRDDRILAYKDMYDCRVVDVVELRFTTSMNKTVFLPTGAPSEPPSVAPTGPSLSPSPTYISALVMVRFRTYTDSRTTGWRIQSTSGEIVHQEMPGFFRGHEPIFLEGVQVNAGEDYIFVITDSDGIGFDGEAILFIGNVLDERTIIAYYEGFLGHFFEYPINFTASSNSTIALFPTLSPVVPSRASSRSPTAPRTGPVLSRSPATAVSSFTNDPSTIASTTYAPEMRAPSTQFPLTLRPVTGYPSMMPSLNTSASSAIVAFNFVPHFLCVAITTFIAETW
jgi:hypothetical protein